MGRRVISSFVATLCGLCAFGFPQPELVWEHAFGSTTLGTPVLYPSVDEPEGILILSEPGLLTMFSGVGEIIWQHDLGGDSHTVPAIGDIDGDGTAEIVTAVTKGDLVVLNGDGSERWRQHVGQSIDNFQGPTLPDLDGDGAREIVCGTNSGYVVCMDGDRDLRWRIRTDIYRNTPVTAVPGASGLPELLVYGTENDHIVGVAPDGDLMWLAQQESQFGRTHLIAGELDGDPGYELTVNTSFNNPNSRVIVLNAEDGSLTWDRQTNLHGYAASAIVDVEADGNNELLLLLRSNTIYLYDGDGTERWNTTTGGHAYFWPGAVADLDGDGVCEIVAAVRDSNEDGHSWFVLNLDGEIIGAYALPGGARCAPIVHDLNGDGRLDVLLSGSRGQGVVRCYTFGGPASGRVAWSGDRVDAARLGCVEKANPPALTKPGKAKHVLDAAWRGEPTWGANDLAVTWPKPSGDRAVVTVTTVDPSGRKTVDVLDGAPADLPDSVPVTFIGEGVHGATVRLFDPGDWSKPYAAWTADVTVDDFASFAEAIKSGLEKANRAAKSLPLEAAATAAMLTGQAATRRSALEVLARQADATDFGDMAKSDAFANQLAGFRRDLREDAARVGFVRESVAINPTRRVAIWSDPNPWDETPALLDDVAIAAEPEFSLPLYKNEYESGCLTILNLQPDALSVQLRPDAVAVKATRLYEVIEAPRRDGSSVDDCLAELNSASIIRLAPGEARRVWVTFDGTVLEPGDHTMALTVVPIGFDEDRYDVTLVAHVDSLNLSDAPVWRSCNWYSQPHAAGAGLDLSAIAVAREHGENVWTTSIPHPKVDEEGNLVDLDWSRLDNELAHYGDSDFVLAHHTHVAIPKGASEHDAMHLKAERAYLDAVIAHMKDVGWDGRWAFYPTDEPGLYGGTRIAEFLKHAKFIREANPNAPIYANPSGFVTPETMTPMVPYVDFWSPEQAVMRRTPGLNQFFLDTGKPVWCYEAPGDVKTLKPLGYYRANSWLAFQLGLQGTGYWIQVYTGSSYGQNDLYIRKAGSEYGANYAVNGRETISRRWEATRDGHEDARAFMMLRDAAAAAKAAGRDADLVAQTESLLNGSVPTAVEKAYFCNDITRFLRDYELDYVEALRIRAEAARLTHALLEN